MPGSRPLCVVEFDNSGATQTALVNKMNEMAQHELDSDRLIKMLIVMAANCRYSSEEVRASTC